MVDYRVFDEAAPRIMSLLRADFSLSVDDAAAITGNGPGHECLGMTKLQEMKPTVKGSRGGWGWMQWTGPRRRAFEDYCKRNSLDPSSFKANYGFIFVEGKGSERKAFGKMRDAQGLYAKVRVFMKSYLRPGIEHLESRNEWAQRAKLVYQGAGEPVEGTSPAEQVVILTDESKAARGRGNVAAGTAAAGGAGGGTGAVVATPNVHSIADWLLLGGFGVVVAGLVIWLIVRAVREHNTAAALKGAAIDVAFQGSK